MPVFLLTDELVFPDPREAEPDGLLAIGGDLRAERLLLAYAHGIFPWNLEDQPLLWWSPSPRAVLRPDEVHVSRSLKKAIRRAPFRITVDMAFERVIRACGRTRRPGQENTWITPELTRAFVELHRGGLAHSVEAWDGGKLVGGLYGLALGGVFCGESMFASRDDASKIAFAALCEQLRRWQFTLIDCQVESEHLRRFGATTVEREVMQARLAEAIARPWRIGAWSLDPDLAGRSDGGPRERARPPTVSWTMSGGPAEVRPQGPARPSPHERAERETTVAWDMSAGPGETADRPAAE